MGIKKAVLSLMEEVESISWIEDVEMDSVTGKEGILGITTSYSESYYLVIRVYKFIGKIAYSTKLQSYAGNEPVNIVTLTSNSLDGCIEDVKLLESNLKKFSKEK